MDYAVAIILVLSIPLALSMALGFLVIRAVRRASDRREAMERHPAGKARVDHDYSSLESEDRI